MHAMEILVYESQDRELSITVTSRIDFVPKTIHDLAVVLHQHPVGTRLPGRLVYLDPKPKVEG